MVRRPCQVLKISIFKCCPGTTHQNSKAWCPFHLQTWRIMGMGEIFIGCLLQMSTPLAMESPVWAHAYHWSTQQGEDLLMKEDEKASEWKGRTVSVSKGVITAMRISKICVVVMCALLIFQSTVTLEEISFIPPYLCMYSCRGLKAIYELAAYAHISVPFLHVDSQR